MNSVGSNNLSLKDEKSVINIVVNPIFINLNTPRYIKLNIICNLYMLVNNYVKPIGP